MEYTRTVTLKADFDQAVGRVKAALQRQGFGTITEIDLRATLREKIGADIEPYLIIGACNPNLAKRALDVDRRIGALLPCNVVVRQYGDEIVVDALDPTILVSLSEEEGLRPIASEAGRLIGEALSELSESDTASTTK